MSSPHQFSGDFERLAAASVASFNEMLPVGSSVTVEPLPVPPVPVRTRTRSAAFIRGTTVCVFVNGDESPVEITRLKGVRP